MSIIAQPDSVAQIVAAPAPPPRFDPEISLTLKITVIARLLRKRFDIKARESGLTRAQWRIIATVSQMEGATQRGIANVLEVSEVTVGRTLDRLVTLGWIERRQDRQDRRAHRIYTTPAVEPTLIHLGALGLAEENNALSGISDEEIVITRSVLSRIARNVGSTSITCDDEPVTSQGC